MPKTSTISQTSQNILKFQPKKKALIVQILTIMSQIQISSNLGFMLSSYYMMIKIIHGPPSNSLTCKEISGSLHDIHKMSSSASKQKAVTWGSRVNL